MFRTLSLLLCLLACSAFAADRTVEKQFKVGPNATFALDNHKGTIVIRTQPGNQISVKAVIYMAEDEDNKMSAANRQAAIDALEVRFKNTDNLVKVEVENDNSEKQSGISWNQTLPTVDFEIGVPQDANLELETHKGELQVQAPSGTIEIESHKGTGTIDGVRNAFKLSTHKGEFAIGFAKLARIEIETHKGDITLELPGGPMTLDATSHKGEFTFNGRKIPVTRERGETSATYTEGAGTNRISLGTHKGHFTVNFRD